MTAPAFDADILPTASVYVEDLNTSTPESRRCFSERTPWPSIRSAPGPWKGGLPIMREFWVNVDGEGIAEQTDIRYDVQSEYDFVAYDPNPNAALGEEYRYPKGERRQRFVAVIKDAATLKAMVQAQKNMANAALSPGDGVGDTAEIAGYLRSQSSLSDADRELIRRIDLRAAAKLANERTAGALAAAIDGGTDFNLLSGTTTTWTTGWITSLET